MKVVRFCTLALSLVHLTIFVSLFVPYMADPRMNLWLTLLPSWNAFFAFSRAPFVLSAFLTFVPLILPLLAAWSAVRPAMRLMGLIGLRISLPLICVSLFFWSVLTLELYTPSSGLRGLLARILFVPPAGFTLSFFLCLIETRYLRRLLEEERTALAASESEELAYTQDREARPMDLETIVSDKNQNLPGLISLMLLTLAGLLCQALILVSLSFPYTTTYDPYQMATWSTTGWQTFGLNSPSILVTIILLAIPLFPILIFLFCRLPLSFKDTLKEQLLTGSVELSYWLNMLGFLLSGMMLAFSLLFLGTDFNKETHWLGVASGIPPATFLLTLIWLNILRVYPLRRQSKAKVL